MKKATNIRRVNNIQVFQDAENVGAKKPKLEKEPNVKRRAFGDLNNTCRPNQGKEDKISLKSQLKPTLKKTKPIKNNERKIKGGGDYNEDIYKYLISIENKYRIKSDYMLGRTSFSSKCRSILVDWMIEIHGRFDLAADTIHMAVYVLDKYMELDSTNVTRCNAQLVAAACLFLAAKFEETMPIDQEDLIQTCNPAITAADLQQAEVHILVSLDFRLNLPLPIDFLRRFATIVGVTSTEYTLAKYFTEASLLCYELVGERPSLLAAGCLFLALSAARDVTETSLVWTPTLVSKTALKFEDFSHVLSFVASSVVRTSTSRLQASRIKYSKSRHLSVSLLPSCQPSNGVITRFYTSYDLSNK